ncbi:MAG: PDZ domain-containing protein [Acidobacteriota bacterium]
MSVRILLFFVCLLSLHGINATASPMPFQMPAVSDKFIAFCYANEIWVVDRNGGEARRLTSVQAAEKLAPVFSPDGSQIAFSMNVGGNLDVYVMPVAGGEPRRLTYHPKEDVAVGWTPDGKAILFRSRRLSDDTHQLYTISAAGGFEKALPLPIAWTGSYASDGAHLAYNPLSDPTRTWRNYRGGQTSAIWIAELATSRIEKLPRENSNDRNPLWIDNKIYFLSDRTFTTNLFVYDPQTRKTSQVTNFEKYDIKAAAAGAGAIVFVQDGAIQVYDLNSKQTRTVSIKIPANDWAEIKPRTIKAARWIRAFNLSNDGRQALFGGRGDILTVSADGKAFRNLTQTSNAAERAPVGSPDGKWIAYYSDESGEYQLHIRSTATDEIKKIAIEPQPSFYLEPVWSPDSRKLAFYDKRLNIWYVDIEKRQATRVDTAYRFDNSPAPAWSPDSRWLAYTKTQPNYLRGLFIYSLDKAKSYQVSNERFDADSPAFDKNGKYLYFTSSANAGPRKVFGMSSFQFRNTVLRSIYAVVLDKDEPSPLMPVANPSENPENTPGIDVEGITERVVRLPIPARDYAGILAGKAGTLFIFESGIQAPNVIHKFDVTTRKFEKFIENAGGLVISDDGSRLMFPRGGAYYIVSTEAQPKSDEGRLDLMNAEWQITPRDEWQQMYNESWRLMRDYFYDANLHGQNLAALKEHYAAYLPNVVTRSDLLVVFREMFSHMTVSHMQVGGGDAPPAGQANVGMLGADFEINQGRYQITRIYRGDNSEPILTSPLTQPGVKVTVGDYLIAIDGQEIKADENVFKYFQGKAGRPAQLKVAAKPDGSNARTYMVILSPGENILRLYDWIQENRRKVAEASGGKLGYIYLPDTGAAGYEEFTRDFYAYLDKQGVIIDERYNSGGAPADYFIDMLGRMPLSTYTFREGADMNFPVATIPGPRVMIINEYAGSGGDTLPWMFRAASVGTLVGKRTWGGGIGGFVAMPELIDGGRMLAPNRAFYNPKTGNWDIENNGVAPDVEVELDPQAFRKGRDLQLEKAIQLALENLKKQPAPQIKKPKRPLYP